MPIRQSLRRAALAASATGALFVPAPGALAATGSTTSTNWAGYAVTGKTFTRVSGSWVQPAIDCTTTDGTEAYSATWVGLGGYDTNATALEQIGTEADCTDGTADYSSWYELVPEAARTLSLRVRPGDRMSASVTVTGKTVRMRLANLTTGRSVVKVRTTSNLDLSSAEWIQETPSACDRSGTRCSVLPLADFGTVTFKNAYATTKGGAKGTITDPRWNATSIDLIETGAGTGGRFPGDTRPTAATATGATTQGLSAAGTSFTVSYNGNLAVPAGRQRLATEMLGPGGPRTRF